MSLQREFRMSGGFGRMSGQFVVVLVFFFVIMLTLGSVFGGVGVGIPVAIGATGGLVVVLYSKFQRMKTGTVIRFSEVGVELSDQLGFRVRLAWPDITGIAPVDTRMATPNAVGVPGGLKVGIGSVRSQGLVGWGERITPPRIPDWMRQNLAAQPVNPVDGRPQVAIPLGGIDPDWLNGPMGQWLRLYRPDLVGAPPLGPSPAGPVPGAQPRPGPYLPTDASAYWSTERPDRTD